jgi:serine/threonine-protein kinase
MALAPGTRLGGYEIQTTLGVGGMGEVYRARDGALGRDVAIKVLPEAFAADPDRLARFEREARTLAALNHPNIAAIYGLERSTGTTALVMELVEGPTLADRIAQGPVPLDEALPLARQLCEALEAAHEQGIVHRDLKPANVKVRPDGTVKVLDFGLAKLTSPPEGGHYVRSDRSVGLQPDLAAAPTITTPAMTAMGMILGTAAYMIPEQARGKPVDKRADVWAFGCVLYELLTGRRAFEDEDVSLTLSQVLQREPDLGALPDSVPAHVRQTIRLCLRKPLKDRIPDIGAVRLALDGAFQPVVPAISVTETAGRPFWRRALPTAAAVAATAVVVATGMWSYRPRPSTPVVAQFSFRLPPAQVFTGATRQLVTISPDGTQLAYGADFRIYLRAMGDLQPRAIQGSEARGVPLNPVFAPDGDFIAYVDAGENTLKRIPVGGGTAVTMANGVNLPCGATWGTDGILIGSASPGRRGVVRVPSAGGPPELIVAVGDDEQACGPQMLPDGRTVLFTVAPEGAAGQTSWDDAQIVAQTLDAAGTRRVVVQGGSDARYLQTGHLLYAVAGTMLAAPFDVSRLAVTGPAVAVIEGVLRSTPGLPTSASHVAVSETGTLAYVPGPATTATAMFGLVVGDGRSDPTQLKVPPAAYMQPRVSPDGRTLAVVRNDGLSSDIWSYEVSGASELRRITFGGDNRFPVWSRDGRRITFQSGRDGDRAIWWQLVDGGRAERLTRPAKGEEHVPESWSPDGRHLLFTSANAPTWPFPSRAVSHELRVLSLQDMNIQSFGAASSSEFMSATFSPDGRWVAYAVSMGARDSRDRGVFVEPFPPTGEKHQAPRSAGRDFHPVWAPDGKALFYIPQSGAPTLSVPTTTRPSVVFGAPVELDRMPRPGLQSWQPRGYDVLPDGRFLSVSLEPGAAEIRVTLNWFE